MPTVAIVIPSITNSGGGVSEVVRLLSGGLIADGRWAVDVHTLVEPGFTEALRGYDGCRIVASRRLGSRRFGFSLGMLRSMLASKADVTHVHGLWGFHCLAAYLWHLKTGKPYVVTPHGMLEAWILNRSRMLKAAISALYHRRFLLGATMFQVLTAKERDDVRAVLPSAPTRIIKNFVVPPAELAALGRPSWWREGFANRTVFLFFGRIHEKKGCMELCDAWERLSRDVPGFAESSALVFCGWVDGLDGIQQRVAELDQAFGNALFAGSQYGDDKWRSLAAATFMVLPSKSEGLPLAVVESWAAGTPVIMTAECNLPEGFEAGAAIQILPDRDGIAAGLARAHAMDGAARDDMRNRGSSLVAGQFSRTSVIDAIVDLYNAAVASSPRRNHGDTA